MFKNFFYKHDWVITIIMILIVIIGLVTIYSTSVGNQSNSLDNSFQKQLIFSFTGILIYFIISSIDYTYLKYRPIVTIFYSIDAFLLVVAAISKSIRGAARWIGLGIVNLQPSEITKLVLIIALSSFLLPNKKKDPFKFILQYLALIFPLIFLVFVEPSLSSTIVLIIISWVILFINSEGQLKFLITNIIVLLSINLTSGIFMPKILFIPNIGSYSLGIILLTIIFIALSSLFKIVPVKNIIIVSILCMIIGLTIAIGKNGIWEKLTSSYQRDRITCFTQQDSPDIQNNACSFQLEQSKIAIGSGGVLGKGFGQGTQSKLDFLPDHNTDFIFASFTEEFGLVGDIMLIGLFIILYLRIIHIAEHTGDRFGFLIICGVVSMLIFQTFANIAINVGALPSTGIPMPLVSYGGSSLWTTFIAIGIVQSINNRSSEKKWISIES